MTSHINTALTVIEIVFALYLLFCLIKFGRGVIRFSKATRPAKRNYLLAFKIWFGWRKLTLNLGLAKVVKETVSISSRKAVGIHLFDTTVGKSKTNQKIKYPRVRLRPDEYGVVLMVKTIPLVGRKEFEDAARFLADAWGCAKVQISQPKPGRLIVRALRNDPLASPLGQADVPADVYRPVRPEVI